MSLIDPHEARHRKQEELKGSGLAASMTALFGLCTILVTAVLGFAGAGVFDQFRIMSLNSVFSSWESNIPVAVRGWALPLGIVGTLICVGQYSTWNRRFTGRASMHAFVGPAPLVLLGLTIGVSTATLVWAKPDMVGTAVDPTFGNDESWGIGAWILYAAQWWLPGILAVLTLLSLFARFSVKKSRARSAAVIAELMRSGTLAEAEVTEAPLPVPNTSRMLAMLTLTFRDAQGNPRWIRCHVNLPPEHLPAIGDSRPLLFDPKTPSDVKRIFVSPTGGTAPDDFESVSSM